MPDESLDFYRSAGPMTALPGKVALDTIPTDLDELRRVVQGLLIHRDWAIVYDIAQEDVRLDEQQLRTAEATLGRAFELVGEPISVARVPAERVVGICWHYALLHVTFLRALGVPARMRCGFGGYFEAGKWVDHWITERWDGGRWVRDDPQIDDLQAEILQLDFDPYDQPAGRFLSGAEAWVAARNGEVDPNAFGILDMWGLGYIVGNVISDFVCLNKVELLPWDSWGMRFGPFDELTPATLEVIDDLAALLIGDDTAAIRSRYATDDRLRVPTTITSFVDGTPIEVQLKGL